MNDSIVVQGAVFLDLLLVIVRLWGLIRALTRPGWAFERANKSKGLWVVLLVIGLFLPCLGYLFALIYLFSTDRRVAAQQQLGPGIGFPGH